MIAVRTPAPRGPRKMIAFVAIAIAVLGFAGCAAAEELSRAAQQKYAAAVRGDADAQAELGAMYATGDGVPQSDAKALQWLLRAANQGNAEASLRLSEAFSAGKGVSVNYVVAYKWAFLAGLNAKAGALQTRDSATRTLDTLAQKMNNSEVADAREQASKWKPVLEAKQPVQRAGTKEDAGSQRNAGRAKAHSRSKLKRRRAPSWRDLAALRLPFQ